MSRIVYFDRMDKQEDIPKLKKWYGLDVAVLCPADIILTTSTHSISQIIRIFTRGSFSHAMLFLGGHSLLEAPGPGRRVRSQNPQRLFFESPDKCKALRMPNLNPIITNSIAMLARQKVGTLYSWAEAKKVPIPFKGSADEWNRQFCSRLVAQAYHEVGIEMVKNPDYCSPADLDRSPKLIEVKNAIREIGKEEYDLFSEPSRSLMAMERADLEVFDDIYQLTNADIQTIPQLTEFLINNPSYDDDIVNILRASGYLIYWQYEKEDNPWDYDYEIFNAKYPDKEIQNDIGANNLDAFSDAMDHQSISLNSFRQLYERQPLNYFKTMITLYENLEQMNKDRIEVWQKALVAT